MWGPCGEAASPQTPNPEALGLGSRAAKYGRAACPRAVQATMGALGGGGKPQNPRISKSKSPGPCEAARGFGAHCSTYLRAHSSSRAPLTPPHTHLCARTSTHMRSHTCACLPCLPPLVTLRRRAQTGRYCPYCRSRLALGPSDPTAHPCTHRPLTPPCHASSPSHTHTHTHNPPPPPPPPPSTWQVRQQPVHDGVPELGARRRWPRLRQRRRLVTILFFATVPQRVPWPCLMAARPASRTPQAGRQALHAAAWAAAAAAAGVSGATHSAAAALCLAAWVAQAGRVMRWRVRPRVGDIRCRVRRNAVWCVHGGPTPQPSSSCLVVLVLAQWAAARLAAAAAEGPVALPCQTQPKLCCLQRAWLVAGVGQGSHAVDGTYNRVPVL